MAKVKVECPSCAAPYELEAGRLPQSGLKMRCPKCGATFRVLPSGQTGPADAPTGPVQAGGAGASAIPTRKTMMGVAPPSATPAAPRFVPGVGAAAKGPAAPAAPPQARPAQHAYRPAPPGPVGGADLDIDVDLPAPRPAAPKRPPLAPPFPAPDDVDLPAPKPAAAKRSPFPAPDDADLPAPKRPAAKPPLRSPFAGDDLDLPALKGAPARKPPLAPPFPAGDEVDLPAPKPAAAKRPLPEESFADLDLPAPKAPPAPRGRRVAFEDRESDPFADLDLDLGGGGGLPTDDEPTVAAERSPELEALLRGEEIDLPQAKGHLDLPRAKGGPAAGHADLPAAKRDADLPAFKRAGGDLGGLDLPQAKGHVDLPAPRRGADLRALEGAGGDFDGLDLPQPKSHVDLPALKRGGIDELDLPMSKVGADLPVAKDGGFGDLPMRSGADLPVAKDGGFGDLPVRSGADLPRPRGRFGDLDLPVPRGAASPPRRAVPADELGDLDLPLPGGPSSSADDLGFDLPDPHPVAPHRQGGIDRDDDLALPPPQAQSRAGAGGTGFGEIDLGGAEGDDMEFADIPEERESMAGAAAAGGARIGVAEGARGAVVERIERPVDLPRTRKPKRGRALVAVLGLLLVIVLAGVGVGLFTPHGYFGIYELEQLLPEAGDEASAGRLIESAEAKAQSDTYRDVRASLAELGQARRGMGLNRRLLARSLMHESLHRVRFGDDARSEGRATAIRHRLESRGGEAPGMSLATAAHALSSGDLARARSALSRARAEAPDDPYVHLVAGELALAEGDSDEAVAAFQQADSRGAGARASWGLARALRSSEGTEALAAAVEQTLSRSPRHAEALVEKARLAFEAGSLDEARRLARQAAGAEAMDGERLRPSPAAAASAFTLLGRIHEQRGNRTHAREAYEKALELDAYRVSALLGAGRVLLADGRHRDALARFEAVLQASANDGAAAEEGRPPAVEARLGAARAMLSLDRQRDASAALTQLAAERPEDAEVSLWLGKAAEALDDRVAAEQHYREAVRLAPDRFDGYLALAQLFFETGRPSDAAAVLTQAQRQVEDTAQVRRMLGESELARNNIEAALGQFRRALELDPREVQALFGLGVAQRRAGRLAQAQETFARVSEEDSAWPGLALERGLVFEAQGEPERAVAMYRRALEERPDDPDLLLRLGASYVAAGQVEQAEETLQRVIETRPNSAEAEHFMGRVALVRQQLPEAMTHFDRAVSLDASRGEYWLYVAWAALEMGDLGRSLEAVQKALELDPSLGDAYWIRGRLRVRTGAVRDARNDLEKALELKPSRYEAYAALGEAYDQLRRVRDAVRAYETAIARDNSRGEWWYRLGRLRMDVGNARGAGEALARATLIGDATQPRPTWLADAHRLHGDAARLSGSRQEAIEHYRKYLEIAPPTAIDRQEVRRSLRDLGETTP